MSIATRIVLGTLAFFNALIFVVPGVTAMWFVNDAAGPILGGCFWLLAGMLLGLARWLGQGTEWKSRSQRGRVPHGFRGRRPWRIAAS